MNFTKSDNAVTELDAQHPRGFSQQELEEDVLKELVLINYSFSLFYKFPFTLPLSRANGLFYFQNHHSGQQPTKPVVELPNLVPICGRRMEFYKGGIKRETKTSEPP